MTDHDASQGEEGLVDVGAAFPANAEAAELVQPADRALHHPTVGTQTAAVRGQTACQNRGDAPCPQRLSVEFGVVSPIALHPIRPEAGVTDAPGEGGDSVHQQQQLGHIGAVGPGENRRQRNAVRVRDQMVFRPGLAAVRGIGARLIPPKTARTDAESATARDQSIRSAACSCANTVRWILSQTPAFCQSRNRRQQVIPDPHPISRGRSSQGMPVFNTNRIPVSTRRLSNGFRPGYRRRRRFGGGSNGAINAHNFSSNITLAMEVPPFHGHKINSIKHDANPFC